MQDILGIISTEIKKKAATAAVAFAWDTAKTIYCKVSQCEPNLMESLNKQIEEQNDVISFLKIIIYVQTPVLVLLTLPYLRPNICQEMRTSFANGVTFFTNSARGYMNGNNNIPPQNAQSNSDTEEDQSNSDTNIIEGRPKIN